MRRTAGFTLIELMVVIAILGVLAASAMPLLGVYRQRASGTEAQTMVKQILEAEIMYYLEHNTFFPDNATYIVTHPGAENPGGARNEIKDNLNIVIPAGHKLDFSITGINVGGAASSIVIISSFRNSFPIFANGDTSIRGTVDKDGKITIF
jgi:prepilin-type N-terminal cleavage/methylation domain-containing protein